MKKHILSLIALSLAAVAVTFSLSQAQEEKAAAQQEQTEKQERAVKAPAAQEPAAPAVNQPAAQAAESETGEKTAEPGQYTIGVADVLEIALLQPDQITNVVTVSPDGHIAYPYIGSVMVKGLTLNEIQNKIQSALANGYMQYPVVLVTLKESRSRKFFVYGEVIKPGAFPLEDNTTILRAISTAGGFTKFGSSNNVKVLRAKLGQPGYELIRVNIKDVMNGDPGADLVLKNGDIVVVSEGMF